jgi:quinol monooxygenase YgiN
MPIGALATLVPVAGAESELVERLTDVAGQVSDEPGNLATVLLRDPEHPRAVLMFEIYQDEAAIEAHRSAKHTIEKGPAVHALLERPMEVRWFEVIAAPTFDGGG